jgi:hypothetical protein
MEGRMTDVTNSIYAPVIFMAEHKSVILFSIFTTLQYNISNSHRPRGAAVKATVTIFTSRIRIPLWDVGTGPLDEAVYINLGSVAQKVWHFKEPSLLKVIRAKHEPKFATLSPVMVTAT